MSVLVQNIIVFVAVGGCLGYVAWQGVSTFAGKKSRVGSCCAKGCVGAEQGGSDARKGSPGERVVFLPVEALARKRK